jgi:hypothetical protein
MQSISLKTQKQKIHEIYINTLKDKSQTKLKMHQYCTLEFYGKYMAAALGR